MAEQAIDGARLETITPCAVSDYTRIASFLEEYPESWSVMLKALGHQEALRLIQLSRDEIMVELRVKHRWSLQAIGDLFGLTRERVRQLTPSIEGSGRTPVLDDGKPSNPRVIRRELRDVFCQAAQDPQAWNARGQLSKSWVVDRLGYEPDLPELDFRSPSDSKTEFILRYGLGLETEREIRAWTQRMYSDYRMSYNDIACWLSQRFVPIAAMTVHRSLSQYTEEGVGEYGLVC